MISPWTIYKDQKDSSMSPAQPKKNKNDHSKHHKKPLKISQNISLPQNYISPQNRPSQTNPELENPQHVPQSSDQPQHQAKVLADSPNPQQNKIQIINQQIPSQNQQDHSDTQDLFRGLDHPQLIPEVKSKDFLKNILSDSTIGYLDNSKLLEFYKNQSHSSQHSNEIHSPKKRRSITNLMRIETEKNALLQEWNELILLKSIKSTLRFEEAIQREVDNNIESVLQKLTQEFLPKISPQELLLEKLLKNEQEKMAKLKQSKSVTKDSGSEQKTEKPGKKNNKKQKQTLNDEIMENLKEDIEKSSIIKYLNSIDSPYLQVDQSQKKSKKNSSKSKDSLNSIQISVNNAKLTEKLIYVSKKPVSSRPQNENERQPSSEQRNTDNETPENLQIDNPEFDSNPKAKSKSHKDNIQKLIKQHIALRQSRKQPKSLQNQEGIHTIEVEVRKLNGKNFIVLDGAASQESNLISPKLNKSKTIDLINKYPGQRRDKTKISKSNFDSPLVPPEFELPQLSHRNGEQDQKKMSSSSKLLELITNDILRQKYKSSRRNSTEDQKSSNSLIDQLFVKDKEKKQIIMRRNNSVNVKNTKEIIKQANRKKFLNLDEQITELKEAQKSMASQNKAKQEGSNEETAMTKDFLAQKASENAYNFVRKKPQKLTALETELIGLIENSKGENLKSQNHMNMSGMKFSDHQIVQEINSVRVSTKLNTN